MEPTAPPPPREGSQKFPLLTPRGEVSLVTRTWSPPNGNVKGIVLIVHGGGWHSGYYEALAHQLMSLNIFVAAYDQPGSGYSDPDPTAPEGCEHVNQFDDLVDEVFTAVEWAQKESGDPNLPLFLLGESFGGIQVLGTSFQAAERGIDLKGTIALGSVLRLADGTRPPWIVTNVLVPILTFCNPRIKLPATDLSETFDEAFGDPKWAAVARKDPKVNMSPQYTVGTVAAVLGTGESLIQKASEFPVPLLALHGKRDCRTQCEAVQEFVDKAGPDASMVILDTSGHQLLQDKPEVTDKVIQAIKSWLQDRL